MRYSYQSAVNESLFQKSEADNEETWALKQQLSKVNDYFKANLALLEHLVKQAQAPMVREERFLDHILKERHAVMNIPKNSPMAVFNMYKKLWTTTWGKMLPSAYLRVLQIRGQGQIRTAKLRIER